LGTFFSTHQPSWAVYGYNRVNGFQERQAGTLPGRIILTKVSRN